MDETSRITYSGDFVQTPETATRGPVEDATQYIGNDVPQSEPIVATSEPDLTSEHS
jgi:hypothetical protein